jgi:hypothetical protein
MIGKALRRIDPTPQNLTAITEIIPNPEMAPKFLTNPPFWEQSLKSTIKNILEKERGQIEFFRTVIHYVMHAYSGKLYSVHESLIGDT